MTKKKPSVFSGTRWVIVFFILLLFGVGYHYRNGLAYYFGFKVHKTSKEIAEDKRISDVRNYHILQQHEGKVIGLDVSEFQGKLDWTLVDKVEKTFPLQFVFIRATVGNDKTDTQFDRNWFGC